MQKPARGLILAAFAALYLIWGSTYLFIRFAIESMPPFLMAGSRFLTAGGYHLANSRYRRRMFAPGRKRRRHRFGKISK